MEILKEIATKVGFTAFVVAVIIFIIFITYLIKLFFKYRKEIKNTIDTWVEKENKRKELAKTVQANQSQIIKLQNDIISLKDEIKQFKDNRVHDREQSLEIQKNLTSSITSIFDILGEMKKNEEERQKAKLKDRIGELYSHFHQTQKWDHMEKERMRDLIVAYEQAGGLNSFVHEKVEPESYTWELID